MPRYTSRDALSAGLPLGGLGTGAVEIMPDGTLDNVTYQDNWSRPIDCRVGNHFAISVRSGGARVAKMLQTLPVKDLPCVKSIEFEGVFPIARLRYLDDDLPVDVSLTAFSPIILGDARVSGTPAAVFRFSIRNAGRAAADVSVMATHMNRVSAWVVGRYNRIVEAAETIGVNFSSRNPMSDDYLAGDVTVATVKGEGEISYHCQWNPKQERLWYLGLDNEVIDVWADFAGSGVLSNNRLGEEITGERREAMGAVARRVLLEPGQVAELTFMLTWHMPRHNVGHIYEHWFRNSVDVASFVAPRVGELARKVEAWHRVILDARVPEFLKDCIIDNLYILAAATWWGRDGSFALYEAPVDCPLMDTLDVRYYGSIPLALFFPELERRSVEEGLKLAEKTWFNLCHNVKNPWNQPDVVDPDTGEFGFGDRYMRNAVAWTVFIALASREPRVAQAFDALVEMGCEVSRNHRGTAASLS